MLPTANNKITIIVTGASGQLGSELQAISHSFPAFEFKFVSREELSIEDAAAVNDFFKNSRPQYCINCAAYTAVDKAETEKEQAFAINAEAPRLLAEVCREYNARFIHVSTDYVFDGNAQRPYREDDAINPQGVYGASKAAGEQLVIKTNPDSIIIRTSWVYSEFGKNFVKTMMKLMAERTELNVVNDQKGSPTYAADLARAILNIIAHCQLSVVNWSPGIYHFSNEGIISWYDFALAIRELTGSRCTIHPIPTSQYPTPAKRPLYSAFDKKKIQTSFQLQPRDWKEALKECIERMQPNVI